jgi:hypothetical protein
MMAQLVNEYFLRCKSTYTVFNVVQTCAGKKLYELGVKFVVCIPRPACNFDRGL